MGHSRGGFRSPWGIPALAVLLVALAPHRARALEPLPVPAEIAIAAAAESGLLAETDFAAVDDPFVGPLRVGRPSSADGAAVSVLLFEGEDGLEQIQVVLQKPWGDLVPKMELAGAMLRLLVEVPDPNPDVAANPSFAAMSREAQWVLGLLSESWAGWPGSATRQVRALDGIAVIAEGNPPDSWVLTLVVDEDYGDDNWPGFDPANESPEVAEARLAVRAGDYRRVHELLRAAGIPEDDPATLTLLGDLHRFARLGPVDQQTAADYYLRAGRMKYAPAVYALAVMSNAGFGVLTLDGLRFPLLETAAESGSADALFVLSAAQEGVFYQRPEGVEPIDQVEAAARLDLLAAQVDLANRYAAGDGTEADPVAAYAWALVAVDNTDPGVDWIRSRELAARYRKPLSTQEATRARDLADGIIAEIGG